LSCVPSFLVISFFSTFLSLSLMSHNIPVFHQPSPHHVQTFQNQVQSLGRNNKQLEKLISATIEQQNKNSKQSEKLLSAMIAKVQKSNEQFSTLMNTLEALESKNQALKTNHAAFKKHNALLTAKVKENKGTIE
jgi:DNA-binding transcriptional MerR regulator